MAAGLLSYSSRATLGVVLTTVNPPCGSAVEDELLPLCGEAQWFADQVSKGRGQ
jgi:hypothetical protein